MASGPVLRRFKGRTHGSSDQQRAKSQKPLANPEPSTHGAKETLVASAFGPIQDVRRVVTKGTFGATATRVVRVEQARCVRLEEEVLIPCAG